MLRADLSPRPSPVTRLRLALAAAAFGALFTALPAGAYQLLGTPWDTERGPSEYALHPEGSDDITDGSDLEAVREAFRIWSCVEGSTFRFRERTDVEGIDVADSNDGINTVFWDEDGSEMLGPGTLGVSGGNGGAGAFRTQNDIVFNGFDHTWSTDDSASQTDVGSIAIHEIGHWLGLGHACTDETESDCLPAQEAVMSPTYPGGIFRHPFSDDVNGLLAMYPAPEGDEATCTGPFRIGEYCTCDDDCAGDLVCQGQENGSNVCSRTCNSEAPDCGTGFNCVLGPSPEEGAPAPGKCLKGVGGQAAQIGAVCENNGFMCGDRDCTRLLSAGNVEVCFAGCTEDEHCPEGYVCAGIGCLVDVTELSIACPSPDPEPDGDGMMIACACAALGDELPVSVLAAVGVALLLGRRRRAR